MTGRVIPAGDVRVGDLIEVHRGGESYSRLRVKYVSIGIDPYFEGDACMTTSSINNDGTGRVITLLDRPKPPLPTQPIPSIRAFEVRGVRGDWLMAVDSDGSWTVVSDSGSIVKIDGCRWHAAEQIADYELLPTVTQN